MRLQARLEHGRRQGLVWMTVWVLALVTAAPAPLATARAAMPGSAAGGRSPVGVLQIRPDVYMMTVSGTNVTVETGSEGTVVVDSGRRRTSAALLAAVRKVAAGPIRFLIDTSGDRDLIDGNARLAAAGRSLIPNPGFTQGVVNSKYGVYASIVAYQSVLFRMLSRHGAHYPAWLLPTETFTRPEYNFYMNGQAIAVIHEPAAHSDEDTVVRFERSDVVATGDIFDVTHFPIIDVKHGGSIDGEIAALNQLLNALVFTPTPIVTNAGGTLVVPVHGHLCEQVDLLTYRDMLVAVRDRIRHLIGQGKSLRQIEGVHPTDGYDSRFGADTGRWTTQDFVKAVYDSLRGERRARGSEGKP